MPPNEQTSMSSTGGDGKPLNMAHAIMQYNRANATSARDGAAVTKEINSLGLIEFKNTGNNILFKNKFKSKLSKNCEKFLAWFENLPTTEICTGDGGRYFPESPPGVNPLQITVDRLTSDKRTVEEKLEQEKQTNTELVLKMREAERDKRSITMDLEREKIFTSGLKEDVARLDSETLSLKRNAAGVKTAHDAEKAAMESRIQSANTAEGEMKREFHLKNETIKLLEENLTNSRSKVVKLEEEKAELLKKNKECNEELRSAKRSDRSQKDAALSPGLFKQAQQAVGDASCYAAVTLYRAVLGSNDDDSSKKRKRGD